MKLEVGMFIRDTRDGKIYKLTDFGLEFRPQKTTYDFEKASHNIIDLIEVGDYVNGKKVIDVWEEPFGAFAGQIFIKLEGEKTVPTLREIKTIFTKEQVENNCYKIGDNAKIKM